MQILAFEGTAYRITAGIFSFVAKVYDVMITLSKQGQDAGTIKEFAFSDIATVMYTIAGVFMLFRVTIAMINMLINPDAINDSKAGAGKLVTRIVTSILMLIAFIPNGWIFGDDGILNRIERALLADDGLIERILPDSTGSSTDNNLSSNATSTSNPNTGATTSNFAMSGLVDDVYATEDSAKMDCYYVFLYNNNDKKKHQEQKSQVRYSISDAENNVVADYSPIHITFYNHKKGTGYGKYNLCTDIVGPINDCKNSFDVDESGIFKKVPYGEMMDKNAFSNGWPNSCPKHITLSEGLWDLNNLATSTIFTYKDYLHGNNWYNSKNSNLVGGWSSYSELKKAVSDAKDKVTVTTTKGDNPSDKDYKNLMEQVAKELDLNTESSVGTTEFLRGIKDEAKDFAQMVMWTFMSCSGTDCDTLKSGVLVTNGDSIIKAMKSSSTPHIELDFIPAVIAGIGILIWVLVLCVDVIVRRFKLLLLQMIAPIPIISYVDPNDQMFDKWKKMYISTYLDLFIKLIAISVAISLLKMVNGIMEYNDKTILKFFYIVAILVFAKMIPSMISDIFGIKNMGGSFKDITGMGKAALGFGAGAAIGGLTGFATGKGVGGRLGGTFKGMAMGAGSGTKGNLTGGAKAIAASNYNLQNARANGLSFSDRLIGGIQSSVGIDPKKRIEDKIKGKEFLKSNVNDVQTAVSDVEKSLEGTNVMKDLKNAFDRGEIDMNAYKSGMSQLAQIWDKGGVQSKDASGKNTGFYETKIQIRDKDGNMYGGSDGLTVKAESGFYEGYKSAVSRFDKTIGTIGSNSDVARTLHDDYGLNLKSDKEGKFDQIQDIKGTTFGADSMLQEEIIGLKNGPDMQKAQAIDSYNAGRK